MYKRKMTFWGICFALAACVGLTGAHAADTVIGQIEVKNGTAGTPGATGASAYQIWLANGNNGSEADFLASLVGAMGPQGVAGKDGTSVKIKGTVPACTNLPNNADIGDIYMVAAQGNQGYIYDGTSWHCPENGINIQGPQGDPGTPACNTVFTTNKTGKVTTITAKDCNNQTLWSETVSDGEDGVGVCDSITSANLNKTVKNTTSVYTAGTATTVGYLTNTRTMCDETTETTDKVEDSCVQVKDARTSGACNGAYLVCTNQTTNATYNVCKAITGQNVSSLSSAIAAAQSTADSAQSAAENAQTTAAGKVDTATFTSYQSTVASTYANKNDVYNKTQVDTAISTATSGLASKTYVDNTVANKQDALTTAQLAAVNSGITSNKITTYDGYATTIASKADASALTTANGKITALEGTVGNASSGLVAQVNTNTSAIGDSTSGLVKKVNDNTSAIGNKLNTADFTSTANTWAGTQTTLAKQADLRTVEDKADQAASDASSAVTTAGEAKTAATTASNNATTALNTATGHTSQINTLNTTVGIGTAGANSVLGRLGTVETTVSGHTTSINNNSSTLTTLSNRLNGTCSSGGEEGSGTRGDTGSSGGATVSTGDFGEVCGKSIEERIADIEAKLAAHGW